MIVLSTTLIFNSLSLKMVTLLFLRITFTFLISSKLSRALVTLSAQWLQLIPSTLIIVLIFLLNISYFPSNFIFLSLRALITTVRLLKVIAKEAIIGFIIILNLANSPIAIGIIKIL